MSLYQELGLENASSADEIRDILNHERSQWDEQRTKTSDPAEAEHAWSMEQGIDHLLNILEQVKDSIGDVTLPLETAACAIDYEVSDYADFEDSVIWVCTHRMFKSDYRKIVNFLDRVHENILADSWRDFAEGAVKYEAGAPKPGGSGWGSRGRRAGMENRNGDRRRISDAERTNTVPSDISKPDMEGSYEATGTSSDEPEERPQDRPHGGNGKKSAGEILLIAAVVVMAVLIVGGIYLIWNARRTAQITEEAAQAAISAQSSSGLISTAGGTSSNSSDDEENTDAVDSSDTDSSASGSSASDSSGVSSEGASGTSESTESDASGSAEEDPAELLSRMADYTILSDETVFPVLNEVSCTGSSATSVLVGESGTSYGTDRLFDDDFSTSWQEGESDDGSGQSLTFTFASGTEIRAIAFWIGSESSPSSYQNSNRPSDITMTITCGDASNDQEMTLDDIDGEQIVVFDKPVPTDSMTITIDGVYRGTQFNDTAISEMKFYTE